MTAMQASRTQCGYDDRPVNPGDPCPANAEQTNCIGAECSYYKPLDREASQYGVVTRKPLIARGRRTHSVMISLNRDEVSALDRQTLARRCASRADYLRYLIEADWQGNLLVIDDGFRTFAEAVGRGFGGAAAELTAQADLYRLNKRLAEDLDKES